MPSLSSDGIDWQVNVGGPTYCAQHRGRCSLSTEHLPRGDVWTARTARRTEVHESEDSTGFGFKPGFPFARARAASLATNNTIGQRKGPLIH